MPYTEADYLKSPQLGWVLGILADVDAGRRGGHAFLTIAPATNGGC